MNNQEAYEVISQGGIVTQSGYWYGPEFYFAFGTYPGCIRGTDHSRLLTDKTPREWRKVTEREVVCAFGYKPDLFNQLRINDGTVDFVDLEKFLSERLTQDEMINPRTNSKKCREYFKSKDIATKLNEISSSNAGIDPADRDYLKDWTSPPPPPTPPVRPEIQYSTDDLLEPMPEKPTRHQR